MRNMKAKAIIDHPLEWTHGRGDKGMIAISSRIRLARNLKDFPFPHRCTAEQLDEVVAVVRKSVEGSSMLKGAATWIMNDMDTLARQILVERHLVSPAFSGGGRGRVVIVDGRGILSLMVNEEDHLRIQVMLGGLNLSETWCIGEAMDRSLESAGFAYDTDLGYLTACPTNTGTGMRASVMVHIPALERQGRVAALVRECSKVGIAVRGTYGEGSQAQGAFYQISNQVTLGFSEEDLVDKVTSVTSQVVEEEGKARQVLKRKMGLELEDRMWRAWGALRYARTMSGKEALEHLSLVRMGSEMAVLPALSSEEWNLLVLSIQPGHVQVLSESAMQPDERDRARAGLIRAALAQKG